MDLNTLLLHIIAQNRNKQSILCVSVQDVSPRSEGRVLVRQPSHRPTYPISPHCAGRPQLQPVPQRAGAGAPRHGPDITWHETKEKKTNCKVLGNKKKQNI